MATTPLNLFLSEFMEFLNTSLGTALTTLVLAYFVSYFMEKGKSKVIKSNLRQLTTTVEDIKRDSQILINQDNADLQRVLSKQIAYQDEARTSLISFHLQMVEWIYSITTIRILDYNLSNSEELKENLKVLRENYRKSGVSRSKLNIVREDGPLLNKANEFFRSSLDLHVQMDMTISEILLKYDSWADIKEKWNRLILNLKKNEAELFILEDKRNKTVEEIDKLKSDFNSRRYDLVNQNFQAERDFANLVRESLKNKEYD